jgi:2-haloalkanoic acid dehalogenase type II
MLVIRAICFDLDNTLWDVEPVIVRAEAAARAWLCEHYPEIPARYSLDEMRAARMELMRREPQNSHDLTYVRTESLARQAEAVGYPRAIARDAFAVFHAARNQIELYPDVLPALASLKPHFRLATLTNGNADLAQIGLQHHFVAVLTAGAIGFAKPDTRAYRLAAQHLEVDPTEVLFVGDDPLADVHGARQAGMRTAWINRKASQWPAELTPADIEVRDLTELTTQLRYSLKT